MGPAEEGGGGEARETAGYSSDSDNMLSGGRETP